MNYDNNGYPIWECNVCDKICGSAKTLKMHKKTHIENQFSCNICRVPVMFYKENKYNRHMRIQHKIGESQYTEKPFQCDQCDKAYNNNEELVAHMAKHTGEKLFQCGACDKSFDSNKKLKNHQRKTKHFQFLDRGFNCRFCDKSFGKSRNLKWHMKTHKGENYY